MYVLNALKIHLMGHTKSFITLLRCLKLLANLPGNLTWNVSHLITNIMATINSKFSNVMLNGSDFGAKKINVVKWDYLYIRATVEVFQTIHMKIMARYNIYYEI